MKKTIYFILLIFFFSETSAQLSSFEKKTLKEANDFYFDKKFKQALPLFLKIDSVFYDFVIKYRIGACYLNTDFQKIKAIPFLEEVSRNENLEIPHIAHFELGKLYHYIYRFDDAILEFNKYLDYIKREKTPDKKQIDATLRMIKICKNAIEITSKPFNAEIEILSSVINTLESEFCPMISADEKIMVFMQTEGIGKNEETKTKILIARQIEENYWEKPKELILKNANEFKNKTIRLAGLSSDGQQIFLNIGNELNQDIYRGVIYENTIINLKPLNNKINTPYFEGRISLSSDGTELYFVSDRPGGFGGTDIYKSKLNRKGEWMNPQNLGEKINTIYDEDSPFLHPDNQTLFFSSEGHNTMGGKDIFKCKNINGNWTIPQNMGVINSTKDDLYFTLNANGQTGYFSSSKNNIYDRHNIFKVNFKDPIPLTLLKGNIKAGTPPKPIKADIKVYDKETGKKIQYVYSPNNKNGEYLMIFPPAKNYDIVVSSKNFMTQIINVYIPYQTYFYELFQEIILQPISIKNKVVGEKITVNNTFYDLYKTQEADSLFSQDIPKNPRYYSHLLNLVEQIIKTSDTVKIKYIKKSDIEHAKKIRTEKLLNLIDEAIETNDPVTLSILDANTKKKKKINSSYFYQKGNKNIPLDTTIIGTDTLFTAPAIETKEQNNLAENKMIYDSNKDNEFYRIKKSLKNQRSYIHKFIIYYKKNSYDIDNKYIEELEEICKLLLNNNSIGAEIYGFADWQGKEQYNVNLSQKRAKTIMKYMVNKRINAKKLITKGFGSIKNRKNEKENRKVEINIFELID